MVAGLLLFYTVLYAYGRFDPVATFRTAVAVQRLADRSLHREYPNTLPIDFMEFFVAVGWGSTAAAAFSLLTALRQRLRRPDRLNVALVSTVQILAVGGTGLLKCETSRVWIFLMPLVAVQVAWEMAAWRSRWRAAFYITAWLSSMAILQNTRWPV